MTEIEMNRIYQIIGRNIFKFRTLQHLPQARLAEVSNMSSAYISQIERSRLHKGMTCTTIIKLADALNVPACVLLAEEACPKYLQCMEQMDLLAEKARQENLS